MPLEYTQKSIFHCSVVSFVNNTMSDQDDTLLDEDLGDEEYDLGNDEEEALLADDYEIDRQNSYKGEEETDDVLDLGVTDALDDLDAEDENVEYRNETISHDPIHCYNDDRLNNHVNYYDQEHNRNYNEESLHQHYEENIGLRGDHSGRGDLREKLQKSMPRNVVVGNGQGMEDDDCEEARERRNRFQNERTMIISPKMNNEIPDSLENVVTIEQSRKPFRGRGRGRGIRGARGARFGVPNMGNFNPRYGSRGPLYEDQKPPFRAPLLETRPPIFPNVPSNMMNPPMMYHQENPHMFQQFPQGGPPRPRPHFNEPRSQFNPNQFPGPHQGPRLQNPRMDFGPRGPMQGGPAPRFNGPPNPQFMPNQPHFQRPPHESEIQGRPMGNHGNMMQPTNPSMIGNMPGHSMPGNQGLQMHTGHPGHPGGMPRPRQESSLPAFRPLGPNQVQQIPHTAGPPGQQVFENCTPFPEAPYDARNMYETRQYNNRPPVNQFNNSVPQAAHHPPRPSVPTVPIVPGHKILINPHFRGSVQPAVEARPTWDGTRPPSQQTQIPNEQFGQQPGQQYQTQGAYNQPSSTQAPQEYQKTYAQNNKNDDPYAYFSDVWQENKTAKPRSSTPPKTYSGESNYSRDSSYRDYDKYKSDSRDNYPEEQRYRDKSPPSRSRDTPQRSRPTQSTNNYHNDSYDHRSRPANSSNRPPPRPPQKRTPEPHERVGRDISPKRSKNSRNFHDTRKRTVSSDPSRDKKDDDVDPEMREYRRKMEAQKRLREKILQEKENRRKRAAMDKSDESRDVKSSDMQQGNEKESVESHSHLANRTRVRVESGHTTEVEKPAGVRIVRTVPAENCVSENNSTKDTNPKVQTKPSQPAEARRVVVHKLPSSLQKTIINQQTSTTRSTPSNPENHNQKVLETAKFVKNLSVGVQKKTTSTRIVVDEPRRAVEKVLMNEIPSENIKKVIPTQSNRVVLQKPIQVKRIPDNKSNTIVIENLAARTSESQIRRMCQGIGTIERIDMGSGTAKIIFKTHSAAVVFHKKYQRKMLDLSMINVKFVPQGGKQTATA